MSAASDSIELAAGEASVQFSIAAEMMGFSLFSSKKEKGTVCSMVTTTRSSWGEDQL